MKKIIMFGVAGAVTMAMGTTGFASCHFSEHIRNAENYGRRTEACVIADGSAEGYPCVFTDEDQDGICDNCYSGHMQDASYHDPCYNDSVSEKGDPGTHHSEGHGLRHHHR